MGTGKSLGYRHTVPLRRRILRGVIHVPHGMLTAYEMEKNPHIGWAEFLGFMAYEISENRDIHDHAYPDICGYLAGLMGYPILKRIVGNRGD